MARVGLKGEQDEEAAYQLMNLGWRESAVIELLTDVAEKPKGKA